MPLLRLPQIVLGASDHDRAAVVQVGLQHLLQGEHLGLVVDQGQVDHAERHFQLSVLEKLIEDYLLQDVLAQLDDDAHAVAVALVPEVGDALDLLVLDQIGYALHQIGLVDLVGDLVDDDALPAVMLLEASAGADLQPPAAGRVRLHYAVGAIDDAPRWEVRTADEAHQVQGVGRGIVYQVHQGVAHLPQVVRRYVGRHAHGDAR